MSDVLYLKIDKNTQVDKKDVCLGDVAQMECANRDIVNKLKTIKLIRIPDDKHNRQVVSVMKVMELILKEYPSLQIDNLGETDFVVTYKVQKNVSKAYVFLKVVLVCAILFFGAAFSIMAFNEDAGVTDMFKKFYMLITGTESDGFTVIEFSYSIGLAVGIIIFYNHFGKAKLTKDPTPIEVEMRTYEDEINTVLVEVANRQQQHSGDC
ncbi:MAG: stage V sporulation protein AA [Lachnospiraceae bacterium]|nr:stage V sporulation protein AA [Lachnospiraceae bacterium]